MDGADINFKTALKNILLGKLEPFWMCSLCQLLPDIKVTRL